MRVPTPPQVRQIIVRLRQEGRGYKETAGIAGVGEATVSRVWRQYRETGSVMPSKPGGGRFSPIRGRVEAKLRALVAALPDSTVSEMGEALAKAEKLSTSRSSVHRALKRMGYSRKKRSSSR